MEKFCVFCGEKPESKTKEHVVPRWLLELTGDPKRKLRLPLPYRNRGNPGIEIAFDALHFPACDFCNNKFSELEVLTKPVIEAMLAGEPLSVADINLLLDWLDKVRIGLWLGFIYLENNPFKIEPKFQISARIARKDRMVVIGRAADDRAGIHMIGVNTPAFHYMPSCFTFVINNLYFFNVSGEFLLARRMGFPFPEITVFREDGLAEVLLQKGRERIMHPVLNLPFLRGGIEIYQTIFRDLLNSRMRDLYEEPYVKNSSLVWEHGIGRPLMVVGNDAVLLNQGDSVAATPLTGEARQMLHTQAIRQTLAVQANLWDYLYRGNKKFEAVRWAEKLNYKWLAMGPDQFSTRASDE